MLVLTNLFQAPGQWNARRKTTRATRANETTRGTAGKAGSVPSLFVRSLRSRRLSSRVPLTGSPEQAIAHAILQSYGCDNATLPPPPPQKKMPHPNNLFLRAFPNYDGINPGNKVVIFRLLKQAERLEKNAVLLLDLAGFKPMT